MSATVPNAIRRSLVTRLRLGTWLWTIATNHMSSVVHLRAWALLMPDAITPAGACHRIRVHPAVGGCDYLAGPVRTFRVGGSHSGGRNTSVTDIDATGGVLAQPISDDVGRAQR